jgi:hypothetical protein
MLESLFFAGFDPLHEVPERCTVCSTHPPVLTYDYRALDAKGEPQKTTGFCCTTCAVELLEKLQRAESQEWQEEEAALESDAFDVSGFRKHRLAAFPESKVADN